jgi:aminoglycoside phosphotransferase (APT) family kinase protein
MSAPARRTFEQEAHAAASSGRRHTLDEVVAILRGWLAARVDATNLVLEDARYPSGAGTSSETVLATARWTAGGVAHRRDLAFRLHPDRFQLFRDPNFAQQHRVLQVLHAERRVRVPEPLFYEADASVLGLPFFVMAQLPGRVPVSSPPYNAGGWLFDSTPAQRRVVWTTAVEELCRIATVPIDRLPFLARPDLGPSGLEQQLEYWRASLDWSTGNATPPLLWQLHGWLRTNLPTARPDGFAWGDARIGNMVFGDDHRLVGVLDWEQANNGGIRQDLGWWLFFDHFHGEGRGLPRLEGLGSRAETIQLWEQLVGEPARDTTWYEVFAGFKIAILSVRTLLLMGDPNARAVSASPVLTRTCELAGIDLGRDR